ncbi:MAG: hypothetical protein WCV92_04990 [Candidatus Buchananbacteria bacterium]
MSRFFSFQYYFDATTFISVTTLRVMLAIFVVMVVAGLGIKVYEKVKKLSPIMCKLIDKYFAMLVVMGFLGILLSWFRYEGAYFVSARFWTVVWVIGIIVWLADILRYQFVVVPLAKKQAEQKKNFTKYLPKRK